MRTFKFTTILAILVGMVSGCADNGIPREAISGQVTLDGQPLAEGSILLQPMGEGPSAGGEIKAGRFALPRNFGPSPGKYRVELSAWKATGKTIRDEAMGGQDETLVAIIPPKYNANSTLEIEVKQGEKNTFDFELSSK